MNKPTYYFDVCVGRRLPEALVMLRPPVEIKWHLGEKFDQAMPDDEWLAFVGEQNWVVISQDQRFHRNEASMLAIKQHNISCFYLGGANDTCWKTAKFLLAQWDKIARIVTSETPPYIYNIKRNGQIDRFK